MTYQVNSANNLKCAMKMLKNRWGSSRLRILIKINICTITVNPKTYFEKFKNRPISNKHKNIRRDKKHKNVRRDTPGTKLC